MLVVMDAAASREQIDAVCDAVRRLGWQPHPLAGAARTAIAITGNAGPIPEERLARLPGVRELIAITSPLTLASREVHPEATVVRVGEAEFGGGACTVIAGPCMVEGEAQCVDVANAVHAAGARMLRGGAYKPRTSPYAFQGMEVEGLRILAKARAVTGLPILTEAVDVDTLALVVEYADMVQVGARNMQNYALLTAAGRCGKPVLLERAPAATVEEWLLAAEYLLDAGNADVVLCERGVRSLGDHARNTLDLAAVPAAQHASHLPVIVDPSHGTGHRHCVAPMARAALAAGADGVMVEVHGDPETARSTGTQALLPEEFGTLMDDLRAIRPALDGRP